MLDFLPALPNGSTSLWLFLPAAILLVCLATCMAWHGWHALIQ
jgi:hypothetical protein